MTDDIDHTPPKRYRNTRTAILARERMRRDLFDLNTDEDLWMHIQRKVPEAWATLSKDLPYAEKKVKITLRVDESVAKTFRATGPGYQERINRVLATWAQMQIAEVERITKGYFELRKDYGLPGTQEQTERSLEMVANDPPEKRAWLERGIVGDQCYIGEEGGE